MVSVHTAAYTIWNTVVLDLRMESERGQEVSQSEKVQALFHNPGLRTFSSTRPRTPSKARRQARLANVETRVGNGSSLVRGAQLPPEEGTSGDATSKYLPAPELARRPLPHS